MVAVGIKILFNTVTSGYLLPSEYFWAEKHTELNILVGNCFK